jgi:hypothetical protein
MSDRGFITWNPRGEVRERLDMILRILHEYEHYLPLTMRQVFYRAVGQYGYDKTEQAYKRLLYTSARARRASMVNFDHVRDDGVTIETPHGYSGLDAFESVVKGAARNYTRDRQLGQDRRIIVLCEAAGMVPQIARVAGEFGVEVRSSGGYDSVTAKYELASHIVQLDMPVTVLHLGDLDPSGEDIFTNIREDVAAFVEHMTVVEETPYGRWREGNAVMEAVRVAVTREQADAMELPTAPPKTTDSRTKNFVGETVQCEAIPPDALNGIVREAIRSRLDMAAFEENLARERQEREHVDAVMQSLSFTEARP